ncbi:MAG: ATP-binding protein [Planctomycetota bacterium]
MTRLQVFDGREKVREVELSGGGTLTVGRDDENDVVLSDASVSRRHAEFERAGNFCLVRDNGSTNGTYVNDMLVRVQLLHHGDAVRIGRYVVRVDTHAPQQDSTSVRLESLYVPGNELTFEDKVASSAFVAEFESLEWKGWASALRDELGSVGTRREIYDRLSHLLVERMGADRCCLFEQPLRSDEGAGWTAKKACVREGLDADFVVSETDLKRCAESGGVLGLDDPETDGAHSAMASYVSAAESRLIIYVDRVDATVRSFGDVESEIFEQVCGQVLVSLRNASLFEDLLAERGKLQSVFSGVNDGVVVTDSEFRVTDANVVATIVLDLRDQNPLGVSIFDLFSGFDLAPSREVIMSESKTGAGVFRLTSQQDDSLGGEFFVEDEATRKVNLTGKASIWPSDESPRGYVFTLSSSADTDRIEKLKGDFVVNFAHKLRTPLTVVHGDLPILRKEVGGSELVDEILEEIERNSERIGQLVDQFVEYTEHEFAAAEPESAQSTSVSDLIRDVVRSQAGGEEVRTMLEKANELPKIFVPPVQVADSVRRILDNAIKFGVAAEVEIHAEASDDVVRIHIDDRGPGIPKSEVEAVFRVGHQIDEARTGQVPGAGLGLTLARQVVRAHGGEIKITSPTSPDGSGTRVSVIFPAHTGQLALAAPIEDI